MSNYYERDYAPSQGGSQYYGPPQQSYGGYDNNYSSYQPPRDDSYRQDMSVTRYDDEEARYRGGSRNEDRYDDAPRRYSRSQSRGRDYDDDRRRSSRSGSRRSRRGSRGISESRDEGYERERGGPRKGHHKEKEVGAGVLGAAIGGFAGHEFGHNKMATTIGALAGAWGGYELEKRHEKKKDRRESQEIVGYSDNNNYSRRSLSRGSRPGSQAGRRSEYDDDEYQRRYERYN